MKRIAKKEIIGFQRKVNCYYDLHGREFPWRNTTDPYHIFVSEIMLQQTQTHRVCSKYRAFIKAFPTFFALAQSSLHAVLTLWQGLGYNKRALMLKKSAEKVIEDFDGRLPCDPDTLRLLSGVGPYTAAAIAAFAFGRPTVFIETNIRTVFIHHFFEKSLLVPDKDILPLISATLNKENPRHWYYALMDFGAMLKKKYPNPNRKSSHYVRQSRFEGSDRQIRGRVITLLTHYPSLDEKELFLGFEKNNDGRIRNILMRLEKDGIIKCEGKVISIAQ